MYLKQRKFGLVAAIAAGALLVSSLPVSAQENQGDVGAEIFLDGERNLSPEKWSIPDLGPQLELAGPDAALLVPLDGAEVAEGPDPASQQEEGPPGKTLDELQDRMTSGPWGGSMTLQGTVVAEEPLRFTTNFSGTVELAVEDRRVTTGSYQMSGPMTISARTPESGFTANVGIQASGPVTGDDRTISFGGAVESSATATMYVTGVLEQSLSVPSQSTAVSWPIQMDSYNCHVAYGQFAASFNSMLAEAGWSPNLTGYLTLVQDREEIRANIEAWKEAMRTTRKAAGEGGTNFEEIELSADLPEVVRLVTRLLQSFNSWADEINSGNYDFQRLIDLLHDADYVLIQLRNLDSCEAELLGENVEAFRTLTQRAAFDLVEVFSENAPTAEQFQLVTFAALNAGLLNRVAPPGLTGTPQTLTDVASEIIEENTCDGVVYLYADVHSVMTTAAQMGWHLTIDGRRYAAALLLNRADDSLAGTEPVAAEGKKDLATCKGTS